MADSQSNWTTLVALSTAAMAVLAAITTLYVGKFSSRTVLMQAQESDQWAYYQAKSIKSHAYELQRDSMELSLAAGGARLGGEASSKFRKILESYEANLKRYEAEKSEIKAKAEGLGKDKAVSQSRAANFGYSLIFFQIAIMLSSISAITKKRELWYMGIGTSCIGVIMFIDGFYLFY